MSQDRRRDVATAATGGTLLAGGGAMRHAGVSAAYPKAKPRVHALGMLKAPKGKRLYWAGSALGLVGLPPLAVGTSHAIRGDVDKAAKPRSPEDRIAIMQRRAERAHLYSVERAKAGDIAGVRRAVGVRNAQWVRLRSFGKADDDKRGFWREGISGSKDALRQRVDTVSQPVPTKLRGLQLGIGAGAGAVGSLAARAALGRRGDALKPVLTPIAGGLAATGSVPLSNRMVRRHYPDYEVTAAGVRRRKTDRKLPSTKASQFRPQSRSLRQDVGKVHNPHNLGPTTKHGTARKVHIPDPETGGRTGMCHMDGSFGDGYGPFAEHPREVTCRGCLRILRRGVAKSYLGEGAWSPTKTMLGGLHGVRTSKVRQLGNRMATDKYFGNLRAYNRASRTVHPVGFRQVDPKQIYQVRKAADERYLGARTPYYRQRAAITAAGHPPVIGPFTASAAAARYAPPGQKRKQAARQYALGSAAGLPVGVAGAYGGAKLANRSESFHRSASKIVDTKAKIEGKARRAVGLKQTKGGPLARATGRFLESKHGEPFRTPRGKVGGAAGFLAGKMVTGGVLGQTAITLNQRDQRAYNARHHIEKMDLGGRGQTKREKHTLAQRKRRSAVLSTVGGTLGLTSLGLLAAGHRQPALTAGTIGSGLGGVNALLGARVQRQEARAVDPVKKVAPLAITGSDREHHDSIRRYGDRGPLPKGLSREERMKAYEARYVHHGGDKQNKWQRRATLGNSAKNVGLGIATGGTAAWLATRGRRSGAALAKHPRLRHHAETVTGTGAVIGGVGEMYSGYAHRKQSSYANSPGGVAASALRRMRENTPEGQTS